MPRARNGEIELEYDSFGQRNGRPLLLVMGLGAQMINWRDGFCQKLADLGHYVVRFDNRDTGLSSKLEGAPAPSMMEVAAERAAGRQPNVAYTLNEMADDAVAVMDAAGLQKAHVCGASMGGMIAQAMAIRHPARLHSMTSIMSSTGNPELPPAKPEAMSVLMMPPAKTREEVIQRAVPNNRAIGSPGFPADPAEVQRYAAMSYDRCFYPIGVARQMAAVGAHGNRKPALSKVTTPTLVLHGRDDALVPVEAGIDTYQAIPGADLLVIAGMGHDLPVALWDRIANAITELTHRAQPSN